MLAFILIVGGVLAIVTPQHMRINIPGEHYFGMFFVLVLFLTFLTMVVHVIIVIKGSFEFCKAKSIIKRVCIGAFIGTVFAIICSLIRYHELFSVKFIYFICASSLLSLRSLFWKSKSNKGNLDEND